MIMKKPDTKITEKLYFLLRESVQMVGQFKPSAVLLCIEESLTLTEYNQCKTFLTWLTDNNKTFGRNLDSVWKEWLETL
jgi:hypothetical protein